MKSRTLMIFLPLVLTISSCSAVTKVIEQAKPQDPSVTLVRTGSVQACTSATLEQMANAFFSDPEWTSFTSTSGDTIVELTGGMSYSDMPATAKLQFTVDTMGDTFETSYLSINGVDSNLYMMSALFNKMCEAV